MNFRWDSNSIQSLPDSMKVVFNAIVEVCDEVRLSTLESEKSSIVVQCVQEDVGFSFIYFQTSPLMLFYIICFIK